jgi:hypothetical protein
VSPAWPLSITHRVGQHLSNRSDLRAGPRWTRISAVRRVPSRTLPAVSTHPYSAAAGRAVRLPCALCAARCRAALRTGRRPGLLTRRRAAARGQAADHRTERETEADRAEHGRNVQTRGVPSRKALHSEGAGVTDRLSDCQARLGRSCGRAVAWKCSPPISRRPPGRSFPVIRDKPLFTRCHGSAHSSHPMIGV